MRGGSSSVLRRLAGCAATLLRMMRREVFRSFATGWARVIDRDQPALRANTPWSRLGEDNAALSAAARPVPRAARQFDEGRGAIGAREVRALCSLSSRKRPSDAAFFKAGRAPGAEAPIYDTVRRGVPLDQFKRVTQQRCNTGVVPAPVIINRIFTFPRISNRQQNLPRPVGD